MLNGQTGLSKGIRYKFIAQTVLDFTSLAYLDHIDCFIKTIRECDSNYSKDHNLLLDNKIVYSIHIQNELPQPHRKKMLRNLVL